MRLTRLSPSHFFASTALATVLAVGLAGCQTTAKGPDTTGSIATASRPTSEGEWRVALDRSEALYKAKPDDVAAAMQYAQALRGTGQHTQAVAVLEQVSLKNPRNKQLLGAYGRALAEVGRYPQALEVLSRAHTPDMPDWRILSAQGAVLDQMGRYEEARAHYAAALKIAPDEPSVLSNLGLSYALSKDLKKAEATLRKATAQPGVSPRVRQNLALVIGLQGRFPEAEEIARADLPPEEAAANVDFLRQMVAQQKGGLNLKSAKPAKPEKPATVAASAPARS